MTFESIGIDQGSGRCLACSSTICGAPPSAVRNLVRRGVPQKTARLICGHKTDPGFARYNIVSEADIRDAARKMEEGAKVAVQTSIRTSFIVEAEGKRSRNKAFQINVREWRNWQTRKT